MPRVPGKVSMYTCGVTVYRYAHVGNMRTYLMSDFWTRALEYLGYDVTRIQNITDVGHLQNDIEGTGEDRMMIAAQDEGKSPEEIADFYNQAFMEDAELLRIKPAGSLSEGHRVHPRDDRADPGAGEAGPDLRGRRQRLLRRPEARRLPQALAQHPRPAAGGLPHRPRSQQAPPGRLPALEGGRRAPPADLGLALGPGLPRLAPGVLGDVAAVLPRRLRHPHRRRRPRLPAPRGRDRPVGAGGRRPGGQLLDPRRVP